MARRRTTVQKELNEKYSKVTWEDAVEQFLDSLKIKGLSYHTRRWHKENLQAVVKALWEAKYATEPALVTDKMLQEVVLKMIDNGLAATTINHRVRSLKQFYQYLTAEAIVGSNPAEKLDRKKAASTVIETFSEGQLQELLAAPDKTRFVGLRDYTIMLLLLDTGVRLSELVGIKLADIKMADNEVIITEGKGGKNRRVFVSPKTKETLKKYLRVRGDIPGNPYLFVSAEDQPMKRRNVQERLTIYGRQTRLEGVRVSPHTFRHTFAKMYIMRGGDPFSLQALLGHSTLDMVRHYVNLWGSDLQKMHRQFSPVAHLLRQ
ncbi:MAG: Tyrosine recombinase XerD [Pelotomaculum sp. PtaB.Bin104]|nr:MAG: Tyrosine recombinase XerD [Pelotomaculum sp. PtaB.Bin104]